MRNATLALLAAALLCACGQKGNLYFPDEEGEAVSTPAPDAAPAATPAEDPAAAAERENARTNRNN